MQNPDIITEVKKKHIAPSHFGGSLRPSVAEKIEPEF